MLRGSEHVGDFTLSDVARLARGSMGVDHDRNRNELVQLVEALQYKELLRRGGR
jgi:hypothetical protein